VLLDFFDGTAVAAFALAGAGAVMTSFVVEVGFSLSVMLSGTSAADLEANETSAVTGVADMLALSLNGSC